MRVLIVDDNEASRRGIRSLLSSRPNWLICGEAADGLEAVDKAIALLPDVILMDISMPRMNGLEATRIIRRDLPESRVVILTQNDPSIARSQALEVDAAACVDKMEIVQTLLPTLEMLIRARGSDGTVVRKPSQTTLARSSWVAGNGELAKLIREKDWSQTSLGAIETWPQSLRIAVNLMLNSHQPMWVGWGPEMPILYNDAYVSVLGQAKHSNALGVPAGEVWREIWDICGPLADKVFEKGEATFVDDVRFFMNRGDFLEETYVCFSYNPIYDESGKVAGLFCPNTETTPKILNARRLQTLSELAAKALVERSTDSACASCFATLAKNPDDLPFALLYLLDKNGTHAVLEQSTGISDDLQRVSPPRMDLERGSVEAEFWRIGQALRGGQAEIVSLRDLDSVPLGPAGQRLAEAITLPVSSGRQDSPTGVLIAGISPARRLDVEYRTFHELLASQVATAIHNARAAEDERKRAEALAEIDRVKTVFFSNVSHEFRTPLTLMLGPVEDLLSKSHTDLSPSAKSQLELVSRNGSRLLRLVNTLLDFSRIEAGRMQVVYQPTDLSAFTVELASVFRAATEKAGLRLELDCPKLSQPVFIDREMWEKIVLNLISNALKFTFEGGIRVSLAQVGDAVELRVRDTGVGIPEKELPRLFDRFHRVENTRSRTHEGSGIGLSLVQELVKLHGGSVKVESVLDRGSAFIVSVPLGTAHLPSDRIGTRSLASTSVGATPFVEEVLGWLESDKQATLSDELPEEYELLPVLCPPLSEADEVSAQRPRVLIADDNADMRRYLVRLLAERYDVKAYPDGAAALRSAQKRAPDLILSDVMMPELDGFGLVRELRADAHLNTVPIILLSARAGEESRIEGLDRGADDYLIKPFSARELLARIQTHLELARVRKRSEAELLRITAEAVAATAKFRAVFEQSSVFAGIMTLDGTLIDANRLSLEVCGYRPDEVMGRPFWQTAWWRGSREVQEKIRAGTSQAAGGTPYREELPYRWSDGTERLVDFALHPILDDQGKVIFLHPTGIDITERKQAERTTGLLAAIVDCSDDAIISKTLEGVITSWNQGAERLFGYKAEEAIGRHISLIIPLDRRDEELTILERLRNGRQIDHFETVRIRKDGSPLDISLSISPVRDKAGRVIGASKVARDVTARRQSERALLESEERFRSIVETTPECVKLVAGDGTVLQMNSAGLKMVGADFMQDVVGKSVYDLVSPEHRDAFRAFNQRICAGEKGSLQFSIVGLNGMKRHMETHAAPFQVSDGSIVQLGVTRDITERSRAEDELRKSEEKLRTLAEELEMQVRSRTLELEQRNAELLQQSEQVRELSRRLLQAQDEERRHIARELHDSAGQIVTALSMNLAAVGQHAKKNAPRIAAELDDCRQLAQQLSQEIRTTSYLLYPPLLDETGLHEALRWYIQGLQERSNLKISLDIPEDFGRLPREMELVLYRVVQESLTNIHRHSGSKSAAIRLVREGQMFSLEIEDAGMGIPAEKLNQVQLQGAGVGLRGMRERIRQFDGRMNIRSSNEGTTISFLFELPETPVPKAKSLSEQVSATD